MNPTKTLLEVVEPYGMYAGAEATARPSGRRLVPLGLFTENASRSLFDVSMHFGVPEWHAYTIPLDQYLM